MVENKEKKKSFKIIMGIIYILIGFPGISIMSSLLILAFPKGIPKEMSYLNTILTISLEIAMVLFILLGIYLIYQGLKKEEK